MPKLALVILLNVFFLLTKAQSVSFTYQSANGLFCAPVAISFTQTSTGNPVGFIWNFGNGQISNAANPTIVYNIAGTYTVKLTAIYATQAAETSQTIVINPAITASLTADRNYICTPGPITFTATSSGNIAAYDWNFGDGSPAVTGTSATISHSYSGIGSYSATVKTTDVSGCFATVSYNIILQNPPINATVSPVSGCIPALVNFNAFANIPAGSSVTNYSWNFGDGSPSSNTSTSNTTKNYTAVGSYSPTLSITTSEGCTNSYNYGAIAFGTPPVNLIAYPDKFVYCGSETPVFVAKATNANAYIWNFGDGTSATVTDTITQHLYATLGNKTVTVTPYFNGCAGAGASFQVLIQGVIAGFTSFNSCANKTRFSFTNTSQGNQSTIVWNFGDGSPTASTINAVHTYATPGAFVSSLSITDNITGCSSSFSTVIYSGNSTLTNPDVSICRNAHTTFTLANNQNNNSANYIWYVVGLPLFSTNNKILDSTAGILGNFATNFVVVDNGPRYCPDTIYLNHQILVRGPDLSFTSPTSICFNNIYNPVNTSKAFIPADTVKLWYWNYGIVSANDTIFQPAPLSFPYPGNFNVKLVAKDNKGCIDSLSKTLTVNPIPFLQIIPANDTFCLGQSDSLIAFHSDSLLWSPAGAVPCTTCDTILVNPSNTTQYFATAKNTFNCMVRDTALITVYKPFTAVAAASPVFICLNESVTINVSPPNKMITWSPAAGLSAANIYNPSASPAASTTYTATLVDSVGCFTSKASVVVNIKSAATVNAGPDKIYPYNFPFTITPVYSNNVKDYLWTPALGLTCSGCASPSGVALQSQTYIINVTSDSGCVAKDSITIFVECKYANLLMPSAFTPNNDLNNDRYYPIARGIRQIKRFAIFNRYGQLVFEAKNFSPNDRSLGWDGRFKGVEASIDTYVYMLEAVCDLGGIIIKKDSFILLR